MPLPAGVAGILSDPLLRELSALAGGAYLVGGVLRDALLQRGGELLDIDLAVEKNARAFALRAARRLGAVLVPLHETPPIFRLVLKRAGKAPVQIDVAQTEGDIHQDLARRDFTINAMALKLPPGIGELLDPFGGTKDLQKGILRSTGPKVLQDDPLRVLRAYRIAAELGLSIDQDTREAAGKAGKLLSKAAPERRTSELMRLLARPDSAFWLKAMDEDRVLTRIFPALELSRRCAVSYYGAGGVLRHTLSVVERADFLLANLDKVYTNWEGPLLDGLGAGLEPKTDPRALVRLACLLHDVAKPACAKPAGGRLRFFGHDTRGADMAENILRGLRFSSLEIETVRVCVLHHLRPGHLAAGGPVSDKAAYRFFRDLGPHAIRLLAVCWADHASYVEPRVLKSLLSGITDSPGKPSRLRSEDARKTLHHLRTVSWLLGRWINERGTVEPKRLLDGTAVMKILGSGPGPAIGRALSALLEAQAEGKVKNKTEAAAFVKSLR